MERNQLEKEMIKLRKKVSVLFVVLTLFLSIFLIAAVPNFFIGGKTIKSSEVNENFTDLDARVTNLETYEGFGYAPIGTILSWHKNAITPELSLPEGWVECDGSSVSVTADGPLDPDGDSLYTVPNLNDSNLFLAGGSASGTTSGSHTLDLAHGHSMNQAAYKIPSHKHRVAQSQKDYIDQGGPGSFGMYNSAGGNVTVMTNSLSYASGTSSSASIISDGTYYSKTDGGGGATTRTTNASVTPLGSTLGENRPAYMSVVWIMRVR